MDLVEILSISGYEKTKQLRDNVEQALNELNLHPKVEEITNVDKLVASDINAIPALRINGKIVTQQAVPDIEELKVLFEPLLKRNGFFEELKNIVVPTDFSFTAKGAYQYALDFAQDNDIKINLIHYFAPELDPTFAYNGQVEPSYIETQETLLKQFKTHTLAPNKGGQANTNKVEAELRAGFPAQEIVTQSSDPAVDLIVMGTTGKGDMWDKLFGSVSSHVAQKAHCPVLLVPKGVRYKKVKNILYASDYQAADEVLLKQIMRMTELGNADIHFVHITEKAKPIESKKEHFSQILKVNAPAINFKMVNMEHKTVVAGLNQYIEENDIDLVVMATSHRPFIEDILHRSTTKKMILNTALPLMVMHFDD